MNIQSLTLRNFGVYAGDHTIIPASPVPGGGGQITLIGGLNGFGKTSLLEAVLLALYGGRSPAAREYGRSYPAYLESLMHRGIPSNTESGVELRLTLPVHNTLTTLRIARVWRMRGSRATESLIVERDGIADPHLAENWDAYVEELIPVGIAGLFFFDGERISEVAESDETTASLRQAIRTLLGLETVDRLIADLAVVSRRKHQKIRDTKVRESLTQLEAESREAELAFNDANQRLAALQNSFTQATKHLTQLEQAYFQTGGTLVETRGRLTARRDTVREELADVRAQIINLASGALPLLLVQSQLARVHASAENEVAGQRVSIALPLIREHDESILEEIVHQGGGAALIDHLRSYLASRQQDLESLTTHARVFGISPVAVAQLTDLVSNTLPAQSEEAVRLRDQAERLDYDLEQIERHLLVDVDTESVTAQLTALGEARGRLAALEHTQQHLEREVQSLRLRRERVQQQIVGIGDQLLELDDAERIVQYATRAQTSLRLFRERVTRTKVAHLAAKITEAFDLLTHKTALVSEVRVDPDTLNIALFTADGGELLKSRLSSGERQMLALAILWGLARASGRTLPVIIDTPMGRLDSSHRMNFVTRYLPNASHQVIVLSTDTEIVGTHLEALGDSVGQSYRLEYDDALRQTAITEGYFAPLEVTA